MNRPLLSRRDYLRLSAAGVATTSLSGWLPVLATHAAEQAAKPKACIVLWMDGGPPHKDTFDMKPETPDAGTFKAIQTAVPGIQISELLPKFATKMKDAAIIRSMSTVENEHLRARYHLRTGYRDGQGGLSYPSLGAIVSAELGKPDSPVPDFVAIADRRERSHGPGYLGSQYQTLYVHDPKKGVENLNGMVGQDETDHRLSVLEELEQGFVRSHGSPLSKDHRNVYQRAVQLMRTERAKAFDLSLEPAASRAAYGEGRFAEGCLMARRLVESGVKFVEVGLDGWDTHFENDKAVSKLCGTLDPVMSHLVEDLKQRGLFDSTLVVWMGEFGGTPKFKGPGRDHYAKAWSTVLMGGGVKGGQVIGKTDKDGATVEEKPVSTADFMATICHILGINYKKSRPTPVGRPITLVEKGGSPIQEVMG